MKKEHIFTIGIVSLVLILGIVTRLQFDLPENFTAVGAIALISGYYLRGKWSWVLPIAILFATDIFLGFYAPVIMASVYGSYLIAWTLGRWAYNQKQVGALLPATLLGAIIFFAVTNFAVWAFSPLYAKTLAGLGQSYYMAIPFFKYSFLGDLTFAVALTTVIEFAKHLAKVIATQETKIIPISVDSE